MSERSLNTRIQNKIDTTANWAKATNFVPQKGEIIVYSDGGGVGIPKMKVGDGTTKVGSLKFIESDGSLSAARNIKIHGGAAVTATSADFDGTKNITIPLGDIYGSYLSWGGKNIVGDISPIDAAMSYLHSANRAQFSKPEGITIEYSNDSGSTWTDYGASDITKTSLVSGKNAQLLLGKVNSGTAPITAQLRITINASKCGFYTNLKTVLISYTTNGTTGNRVMVERANIGSETNFTSTIGTYDINGQPSWNSLPLTIGAFGGNPSQTFQCGALRFTFSFTNTASNARPAVLGMMFLGTTSWVTPSEMARTGHLYSWDVNQNATFPAGITATSFNGPASSVSNALSINGKTYNGSAAVDVGVIGAEYGGSGKTTLRDSAYAFLGALPETVYAPQESAWVVLRDSAVPITYFWQYIKNKADSVYQPVGTYLTSLPVASSSTLGGVKIGSGLTVAEDGTISAAAAYTLPTASSSVKGGIKVGTGLTMSSETLNHSNSITAKTAYGSTATTASANGGSITVTDIKYDAQGHITGSTDRTITLSQTTYTLAGLMGSAAKGSATQPVYWNGSAWTNTTYTLGKSVPADAKFTDTVYTLPTASSTLGGVKTTSTVSATTGLTACPIIDGVVYYKDTNNTYTLAGLVGSTAIGTATNPIYWDGTKFVKTTYTLGKSVPADAKFTDTVYTLPTASSSTLGGIKLGAGLTAAADGTVNVNVGSATQSETISIATTDWSGSGPYTATKTLTNTYDSTTHDVIISLPQMSSSDVAKYDAIASAKMVISACNGTSVTIVALGDKPTVPVSIAIMQV